MLDKLRLLLRYDEGDGTLYWLERTPGTNGWSAGECSRWNKSYAGKPALHALNGSGYRTGSFLGRTYRAHRIVWALAHGRWPEGEIDHINGDKTDNRLSNLREVSHQGNCRNRKRLSCNTSGVTGVGRHTQTGKWHVRIANRHLGLFSDFEDACEARAKALREEGYHETHGSDRRRPKEVA